MQGMHTEQRLGHGETRPHASSTMELTAPDGSWWATHCLVPREAALAAAAAAADVEAEHVGDDNGGAPGAARLERSKPEATWRQDNGDVEETPPPDVRDEDANLYREVRRQLHAARKPTAPCLSSPDVWIVGC